MINVSHFFPGLGTYPVVVTVSTDMGCIKKDTVQVTYVDVPHGNIIAPPVCGNTAANFTFNNTGLPVTDYYWDFGDLSVTNDTSGLASPNYTYNSGTYTTTLIVSTANGCLDTMTTNITIAPLPDGTITNVAVCVDDDETFNFLQTSADTIVSYAWIFPTGTPSSSSLISPISNFGTAGVVTVSLVITNQAGCVDTINQPFLVRSAPVVAFGVYPICISRFTFDPMIVPDTGSLVLNWTLGDGTYLNNVDTSSFNHIYLSPGDYNVTLALVDQYGCSDSVTQVVHVDDSLMIEMPNVLVQSSTLGNNHVDLEEKYPGLNSCIGWTYTVYDRWGVQLFEAKNDPYNPDLTCENCFKGMAQNGTALTPGVYFYIMKGNFNILKSGFITIFE